jgi:hypothetical protein
LKIIHFWSGNLNRSVVDTRIVCLIVHVSNAITDQSIRPFFVLSVLSSKGVLLALTHRHHSSPLLSRVIESLFVLTRLSSCSSDHVEEVRQFLLVFALVLLLVSRFLLLRRLELLPVLVRVIDFIQMAFPTDPGRRPELGWVLEETLVVVFLIV